MGADNSGYVRKSLLSETVRQLQKCGAIETENQIGCEMRWEAQCQTASEAKAGYPQREENAVEFFGGDAGADGPFECNEHGAVKVG